MKNIKYFIVAIILMLTSCKKYTDLEIYFGKVDLDKNSLYYIFFDGKLMEVEETLPWGTDIYVSPGGKNKTVKLDYSYTMNGTLYSSKDGGLKSYYLDRSKDFTGETYSVYPTGDRDEPLLIRNFDDIPSSSGSGGNSGGGNNNSGGGGGNATSNCSNYWMPGGDCLDVRGNPGIKIKICKQSETSSQVTVKAHFEPNNQGIDENYYSEIQLFAGGNQTKTLTIRAFNNSGWISNAFTINKTITAGTGETAVWSDAENIHIGVNSGIRYTGSSGTPWCIR